MRSVAILIRILGPVLCLVVCVACSTTMNMEQNSLNVDNLNDSDSPRDPNRIVCRRYEVSGSPAGDRICMTAGQWQRKSDESARNPAPGSGDGQ